jgi:photosystem II stability/assembly factor-like uncharacterized protein
MRRALLSLVLLLVPALPAALAAGPGHVEDAALHAVQMVDDKEGWAVGDEGVIWHTIDGGHAWERQRTGLRASLRSVCFLNAYVGWVAGRQELPHGGGSAGVLLFTKDGGCSWQRLLEGSLPGLNRVRFSDAKHGFLLGDGTDLFPTGVLKTTDGGRRWEPVAGPQCPGWLDADFDGSSGALTGAWGRLATLRQDTFVVADVDPLGGRSVQAIRLLGNKRALAVGQGGLVLVSRSRGAAWGFVDLTQPPLQLSAEALAALDFHAIDAVGDNVWIVGRPGSVVLHSGNGGGTWRILRTGQPLPLHGVYFLDERKGWAVGELGCILHTDDGGTTWKTQRRGGQRAAVLLLHARGADLPVESVALLGEEEGFLMAGVWVAGPDPKSAAPGQAAAGPRFAAALRTAGGAAGELLWQMPLPQHLADADKQEVLQAWDQAHGGKAAEQLLGQMVLVLRTWRPDVVVTDYPDGRGAGGLVAEAVHHAFSQAGDPAAFPEQIERLGLEAWRPSRVFALWDKRDGAQVAQDGGQVGARLKATARAFVIPACGLLYATPPHLPGQRYFRLLDGTLDGAGHGLLDGLTLPAEGVARRTLPPLKELTPEEDKAQRARRTLQQLAEGPTGPLAAPGQLLAQVKPVLEALPQDQGAAAAFALGSQYARAGQWPLAQEVFLMMADRYSADPLTAEAYRWLIRHNSSSEVRRRYELGQFVAVRQAGFVQPPDFAPGLTPREDTEPGIIAVRGAGKQRKGPAKQLGPDAAIPLGHARDARPAVEATEPVQQTTFTYLSNQAEVRSWSRGSLEIAKRLDGLGPIYGNDPSVQFCLQAARRQLGDFQGAEEGMRRFMNGNVSPVWRSAAGAELWLAGRQGMPPRPVVPCRWTATRPFLDGDFEDPCWQGLRPVLLQNAVRDTLKEYKTEARFAYDSENLYIALRCTHPAAYHVAPLKPRPRDADLRPYDRVSILLDLDRDYSTFYHLQIDQRGCVCEDCWGDKGWNPKCYVAVRSTTTSWQIEAAVPLVELTGQRVPRNAAWACNVVRVLPGRGVQAVSLPADVEPRPEGMGLLLFHDEQ